MSTMLLGFAGLFLLSLIPVAWVALRAYRRFRGTRVITCPETGCAAAVEVDKGHAAATYAIGEPDLRLTSCSRWPEREGCGQECLSQIEASPEGCLVRNMLIEWYQGLDLRLLPGGDPRDPLVRPQARARDAGRQDDRMARGEARRPAAGLRDAQACLLELPHRPDLPDEIPGPRGRASREEARVAPVVRSEFAAGSRSSDRRGERREDLGRGRDHAGVPGLHPDLVDALDERRLAHLVQHARGQGVRLARVGQRRRAAPAVVIGRQVSTSP